MKTGNQRYELVILAFTLVMIYTVIYVLTRLQPVNSAVNGQSGGAPVVASQAQETDRLTAYPRVYRNGYEVIQEARLIQWARQLAGVSESEDERIFYVPAGYWRYTLGNPAYQSDPNHPIFLYTVKGKLQPAALLLQGTETTAGGTGAGTLPTEASDESVTSATIGFDAVSGEWLYYAGNVFTADPSPEVFMVEGTAEVLPMMTETSAIPVTP